MREGACTTYKEDHRIDERSDQHYGKCPPLAVEECIHANGGENW